MRVKVLDLFSGAGGMAKGLEDAGMETIAFCEINKQARQVLTRHWPEVPIYGDVRDARTLVEGVGSANIIAGGDPCPCRSKAANGAPSKHPDLSGYFLAVVAGLRPRWVVRENVPASDDIWVVATLELLGYGCVIVRTNAETYTAQRRQRDFVVGCNQSRGIDSFRSIVTRDRLHGETIYQEAGWIPCLTTRHNRREAGCPIVWEGGSRFRVLSSQELSRAAGFPIGWFEGLSHSAIARLTGNAVVPEVAKEIGKAIMESDSKMEESND